MKWPVTATSLGYPGKAEATPPKARRKAEKRPSSKVMNSDERAEFNRTRVDGHHNRKAL